VRVASFLLISLAACPSASPTASPAPAPSTDTSATVAAIADHQRAVAAHLDAARAKASARDGAGCLAELDAYDRDAWGPSPSTSPSSAMAMSRAMCMMLAGDCVRGKDLYRAAVATNAGATLGPDMLDKSVDVIAAQYCQGAALDPRDALLKALMDLNAGAYMTTTTPAACRASYDTARRLLPDVKARNANDEEIAKAPAIVRVAGPECFARAGDCDAAWGAFRESWLAEKAFDEGTLRTMFGNVVRRCSDP
jgi:hypothetical protein